jgi:hypothetical protein
VAAARVPPGPPRLGAEAGMTLGHVSCHIYKNVDNGHSFSVYFNQCHIDNLTCILVRHTSFSTPWRVRISRHKTANLDIYSLHYWGCWPSHL